MGGGPLGGGGLFAFRVVFILRGGGGVRRGEGIMKC